MDDTETKIQSRKNPKARKKPNRRKKERWLKLPERKTVAKLV
jgi:hypothetical protein